MAATVVATAAALAEEFDRSFMAAPAKELAHTDRFFGVRLGEDSYAVMAAQITAMFCDHRVVRLPSKVPSLLGVAAFRGRIAPVYDLAALLGYPGARNPRWVLLAAGGEVAVAASAFEGQFFLSYGDAAPIAEQTPARSFIRSAVRAGHLLRPIVDMGLLLEELRTRAAIARAN